MKIVKEFAIVFLCLYLGSVTKNLISFPIPETVYGMIYLFILLTLKIVKVKDVDRISLNLLDNLSLFLIPPSVAFINVYPSIKEDLLKIAILVVISSVVTMVVTGKVVTFVQRRMINE